MMQSIEVPHLITYDTRTHVDIHAVAKSLLATADLIELARPVIEKLMGGTAISISSIRIQEVSNGSPLKEMMWVGLFLAFQKELENEVPVWVEQMFGVSVPEDAKTIVTVLVMILAISIIDQAVQRFMPSKDIQHLRKTLGDQIGVVAEMSQSKPEDIRALVVEQTRKDKLSKKMVMAALNWFFPARQDEGVMISGGGGMRIPADAVREVPPALELLIDENKRTRDLFNVLIDIHRADRDSTEAGWRGIVEEVSKRKLRLQLAPTISPDEVFGRRFIHADVVVVEERQKDGKYRPGVIHIMAIRDSNNRQSL
jgi:hypothetical protein